MIAYNRLASWQQQALQRHHACRRRTNMQHGRTIQHDDLRYNNAFEYADTDDYEQVRKRYTTWS